MPPPMRAKMATATTYAIHMTIGKPKNITLKILAAQTIAPTKAK